MDRLVQHNVLARSGRAVEAAGDCSTLLLDKTGTITLGNRQAAEFVPRRAVTEGELADAAQLSSLADETPEGRSIVVLAKETVRSARTRAIGRPGHPLHGPDPHERRRHRRSLDPKGAAEAIRRAHSTGAMTAPELDELVDCIAGRRRHASGRGRERTSRCGVIHLKDIVKDGMRERFDELRRMGIRTIMITGDNPLHCARHRRGGRRGRLRGRGDARGQDAHHPRGPGRRAHRSP